MVKDRTLYDLLQVEPDSDETQIKKAYNRLSKIWHPDKNPDNQEEAHKKFQEITQAKDILLDSEKRAQYDALGLDALNDGGAVENPFESGFPFAHMFNGQSPFGMHNQQSQVEELRETLNCTLEQIYNESTVKVNYKIKSTCNNCDGKGTRPNCNPKCPECDGRGMKIQVIRMGNMIQQMAQPCGICSGSGTFINNENKCMTCNGKTFVYKEKSIDIPLKSKLMSGNKIIFSSKGHNINNVKSDLVFIINVKPHDVFTRQNVSGPESFDLYTDIELTLYQALFGFDKCITHLDGRKIKINYKGKTDFNTVRKVPGEGIKSITTNEIGNLYIRFLINIPDITNISNTTKLELRNIFQEPNEQNNEQCIISTLNNCKKDEINKIHKILYNIKYNNDNDDDNQSHNKYHKSQSHQQCVHQ